MRVRTLVAAVLVLLGHAAVARAQWESYLAADVARWSPAASPIVQHTVWPDRYEQRDVAARYDLAAAAAVDVRGGVRRGVGKRLALGAGLGYTAVGSEATATVTASVPHPLLFDRPASAASAAGPYDHTERAAHLEGSMRLAAASMVVSVFGGPSRIWVKQPLVAGVQVDETLVLTEALPYGIAITGVETRDADVPAWGYTAGVDVAVFPTRRLGGGVVVRYTHADLDLPAAPGVLAEPPEDAQTAGGWTAGAGVRLRF